MKKVVVIGAGAFGGWTALRLVELGYEVTLLDAYGAGNSLSSSGDETRIIRAAYTDAYYAEMAGKAKDLWVKYQNDWNDQLFFQTGVLSLIGKFENRWKDAKEIFDKNNWSYKEISENDIAKRYPMISTEGIDFGVVEEDFGFLMARKSCMAVLKAFENLGGQYLKVGVQKVAYQGQEVDHLVLDDGQSILADKYVFACGAWLPKLFPEHLEGVIKPTKQEILYISYPPGQLEKWQQFPTWLDFATCYANTMFYGILGSGSEAQSRGFKIGEDKAGHSFDPETDLRIVTEAYINRVQKYLEFRFPQLAKNPIAESRVCLYESTADANFIIDRLPSTSNAWILGGGSGHGFKMGPALGHYAADIVTEQKNTNPIFQLKKLDNFSVEVRR